MIKKKVNEFPQTQEAQANDIVLISKEDAGIYTTNYITASDLRTYMQSDLPDAFDADTALHKGTTTGHLSGTTTIKEMADKVDALSSSYEVSTPFNYMMLTKGFTTQQIGWTTDELTFSPMTTSYGGFVSSAIDTLKSCKSYIELWIPPSATNFRSAGCINFSILTSESATTNNKIDLSVYQSSSSYGSPTLLKTLTGLTSTDASTPLLTTLNKFGHGSGTELVSAFGGSIITFVFTFYSFNNKFSALLSGNVNYVCG